VSDNLTALAAAAGQALVQSMVSDGWSTVRGRVVHLFGRGDHQRELHVAAQLDAAYEGVHKGNSDIGITASRWQGRIETLLDSDPEIAAELTELVRELEWGLKPVTGPSSQTVNADRGSYASGRDMHLDQRQDHSRSSKNTNYGGIVAGTVAVIIVIAVLLIGRTVYVNLLGSGSVSRMNESTTCKEFLAADSENQGSVMKGLFLKYNNTQAAGDPFIVQNAQFECGQNPDMTLGQLAR
jgi:hypothetical protein